jgi:hypothetical protein
MTDSGSGAGREIVVRRNGGVFGCGGYLIAFCGYLTWRTILESPPPTSGDFPRTCLALIMLGFFLWLGVGMCLPWCFRIRFGDRRYQLITEWDWLTFRRQGHTGSFDEFDRIRFQREEGDGGPVFWVSDLVWKDPRRRSIQLRNDKGSEASARQWAERLAQELGVRLEG